MKTLSSILTFLTLSFFVKGQEFSFEMYFEDALGYKDTLVFGYDDNATDTIDLSFEEVNIRSTPFDSIFETRISDFDFSTNGIYISDPTTVQSKKQIQNKDCLRNSFPFISAINLNKVAYPLDIYWDSSLFF